MRGMQNQKNVLRGDFNKQEETLRRNLNNDMRTILGSFFQNQPSTSSTLPSNIVPNPKGEKKAITTCSGLAYEGPSIPTNSPLEKVDVQNTEEILDKEHSNCPGSTAQVQPLVVPISISEPDVPRTQTKSTIPYPSSLLANKDKLFELAKVPLNENCSAMLLKKLGDPGKFLIPCDFPGLEVCHALADLGASINLMPLSIWKTLSLLEITPTCMTLELADRSITRPKGVAEDVFVKVGKFYFPTDFVVVDFEADPRVPLILGRSFLRIGHALIDVYGEEITLRVNEESITFNLNHTIKYSSTYDDNSVNRVDVIDIACEDFVQDVLDFQSNPKSSSPTLVFDASVSENDAFNSLTLRRSAAYMGTKAWILAFVEKVSTVGFAIPFVTAANEGISDNLSLLLRGMLLGKLKYFLSIKVIYTDKGICLNQRKYVLDLLSEYGLEIHITECPSMTLKSYSDVDWAKCVVTRRLRLRGDVESVVLACRSVSYLQDAQSKSTRKTLAFSEAVLCE
nr:hypothetical protein [Tanacetum cinerariifolium]